MIGKSLEIGYCPLYFFNFSSFIIPVVCVGRDPRKHGARLADAFGRGVEDVQGVRVVYTGIATTPSMFDFCR